MYSGTMNAHTSNFFLSVWTTYYIFWQSYCLLLCWLALSFFNALLSALAFFLSSTKRVACVGSPSGTRQMQALQRVSVFAVFVLCRGSMVSCQWRSHRCIESCTTTYQHRRRWWLFSVSLWPCGDLRWGDVVLSTLECAPGHEVAIYWPCQQVLLQLFLFSNLPIGCSKEIETANQVIRAAVSCTALPFIRDHGGYINVSWLYWRGWLLMRSLSLWLLVLQVMGLTVMGYFGWCCWL